MTGASTGNTAVTRTEFESHRGQIAGDLRVIEQKISDESEARQRDTRAIRADIQQLAGVSGRPQYQALGFAFTIFSFVIIVVAGVYTWGQSRENELHDTLAVERIVHQGALIQALTNYDVKQDLAREKAAILAKDALEASLLALKELMNTKVDGNDVTSAARDDAQAGQLTELSRRLEVVDAWIAAQHIHVTNNSAQDERLRALERLVHNGKHPDD